MRPFQAAAIEKDQSEQQFRFRLITQHLGLFFFVEHILFGLAFYFCPFRWLFGNSLSIGGHIRVAMLRGLLPQISGSVLGPNGTASHRPVRSAQHG